ncbi:MAG: very short patch repair endonuclease [Acidobacteria bacterium]|nr:MAG: very short patch repair endonuclease [Acidobacteriota bacterium]
MSDVMTPEQRSRLMRRVGSKDTRPERVIRSLLHTLGYRFRLHRKDLPGTPDLVLPKYRTAIFVHGCFWHSHDCPKGARPQSNADFWGNKLDSNRRRDARVCVELQKRGWKVLTLWECQLSDTVALAALVNRELRGADDLDSR